MSGRVDQQCRLGVKCPGTDGTLVLGLVGLHMLVKVWFLLKSHPALGALELPGVGVLLLVDIPPVLVGELPVAHLAMVAAIAKWIMDHSQVDQEAAPQLEDFGANVAHKSVVIMYHPQVVDKLFIHLENKWTLIKPPGNTMSNHDPNLK